MAIATFLKKLLLGRAFSAEEGRIVLFNTLEVSMIESKSLVFFLQKVFEKLGDKTAYEILKKSVEITMLTFKNTLKINFSKLLINPKNWLGFMDFYGWGKFELLNVSTQKNIEKYSIKVSNSPFTQYAKQTFGKNSKVCKLIEANLEVSFKILNEKAKSIKVEEKACYTKGSPYCIFDVVIEK
jgi:predicted hydrocarbon binding protein